MRISSTTISDFLTNALSKESKNYSNQASAYRRARQLTLDMLHDTSRISTDTYMICMYLGDIEISIDPAKRWS